MRGNQLLRREVLGVVAVIVALASVFGVVQYRLYTTLESERELRESRNMALQERIHGLEEHLASATSSIDRLEREVSTLKDRTQTQQGYLEDLNESVRDLGGDVNTLRKLENTDEELLAKYSKVYFLNEHYVPKSLTTIPEKYRFPEDEEEEFHAMVWPHLRALLEEARDDGVNLRVVSAYRSFEEQNRLKSHYNVVYGEGTANQFSAPQGYSEHQLGTTVDVTIEELGTNFEAIGTTPAYEWLQNNAHKHGFILSYSEDNEYYQFEPWHWRYVGVELAKHAHQSDTPFYEMSQRTIDSYRSSFFD